MDGALTYKNHFPANPPAKDIWAVTVYDTQTRSQLQTEQKFSTVESQTEGLKMNDDGSYDIYLAPEAPLVLRITGYKLFPEKVNLLGFECMVLWKHG